MADRLTRPAGSGYGDKLHILGLQDSPDEIGSVIRTMSGDSSTGAAVGHSNTITVGDLFSAGVGAADNGFDLLLDLNESGQMDSVTLNQFMVFFTDNLGNAVAGVDASATFMPPMPLVLPQLNPGNGQDDYFFHVDFTPDQWLAFTANPLNSIGMSGSISGSNDGADIFSAAASPVPEPASLLLLALGGVGALGGVARRRRSAVTEAG